MLTESPCKMYSYCELRQKNFRKNILRPRFHPQCYKVTISPIYPYLELLINMQKCLMCLLMGNNKTHVVSYMVYVLANQKGCWNREPEVSNSTKC